MKKKQLIETLDLKLNKSIIKSIRRWKQESLVILILIYTAIKISNTIKSHL